MTEILKRLADARRKTGLTQADVSAMLGLTRARFSDVARGRTTLTVERMLHLCDIYGCSVVYILTGLNPNVDALQVHTQVSAARTLLGGALHAMELCAS